MTYASAQKFGGEVYKDDLSLESYLDIVGVISYDVRSACGLQELTVTLEGVSSDGQTIYTVSSDGTITSCWQ